MTSADWQGLWWGLAGSAVLSVILWLVLPRGVVLTKVPPSEMLLDRWTVRNESPLPVRITSVSVFGLGAHREVPVGCSKKWVARRLRSIGERRPGEVYFRTHVMASRLDGGLKPVPMPCHDAFQTVSATMTFTDEVLEIGRTDRSMEWGRVKVPPGETLIAHVGGNTTVTIRYRRAGLSGRLERRSLTIHGFA